MYVRVVYVLVIRAIVFVKGRMQRLRPFHAPDMTKRQAIIPHAAWLAVASCSSCPRPRHSTHQTRGIIRALDTITIAGALRLPLPFPIHTHSTPVGHSGGSIRLGTTPQIPRLQCPSRSASARRCGGARANGGGGGVARGDPRVVGAALPQHQPHVLLRTGPSVRSATLLLFPCSVSWRGPQLIILRQ